jgi:hypothetical protein
MQSRELKASNWERVTRSFLLQLRWRNYRIAPGLALDRNIFESSALIALHQQKLLHFERTGGIVNSLEFFNRNATGEHL